MEPESVAEEGVTETSLVFTEEISLHRAETLRQESAAASRRVRRVYEFMAERLPLRLAAAGAGIGSGSVNTEEEAKNLSVSDIEISGGNVTAEGRTSGAGIGGGQFVRADDIKITGGTVNAKALTAVPESAAAQMPSDKISKFPVAMSMRILRRSRNRRRYRSNGR